MHACMQNHVHIVKLLCTVQACMCVSESLVFNVARRYGHRGTYLNNKSTVNHCNCTCVYPSLPGYMRDSVVSITRTQISRRKAYAIHAASFYSIIIQNVYVP